jgi:hypothetical protein
LTLTDRLVARIAVPTAEARRWISATALEPEELFPSRHWDGVFGSLLSPQSARFFGDEAACGRDWGQIQKFDFHA